MTYGIVVELDTGALLFYGIPFIIVVGWFSSRLLGVHRGWGRSFVAGFFGWVFGVSIAAFIENENIKNTHQLNHVLLLALFFGVLISMFVGLILDVILKPRTSEAPPVPLAPAPDRDRSNGSSRRWGAPARSCATHASGVSRTTRRRRSWRRPSSPAACASRWRTAAGCS